MNLTREAAERAMTAFAVVAANGNSRRDAEPECRRFLVACIAQLPRECDMAEKNKVDASKENALECARRLVKEGNTPNTTLRDEDYRFLIAFIDSAARRLPSQKAIDRDRDRKRKGRKAKKVIARLKKTETPKTPPGPSAAELIEQRGGIPMAAPEPAGV